MFARSDFVEPKTAELLLVRHGETEWSADDRYASGTDISLSSRGREQAAAVARWLLEQGLLPDRIISSNLWRAVESASIIARQFEQGGMLKASLEQVTGLREVDFGPFEGRTFEDLSRVPEFQSWRRFDRPPDYPDGVEPYPSAADRFDTSLRRAGALEQRPQRLLVVCHSHVLRSWIIHKVLNCAGSNPNNLQIDTGSITFVAAVAGDWRLHFLNLLPYLQEVTHEGS